MIKRFTFIIIFFLILSTILTFPLIFKMNSSIAGWHSTDESFAVLWNFWWLKYAFMHRLDNSYYSVIAVPFGFDTGKTTLYPAWHLFYKWLAILTNPFIALNIQILCSFVLSGVLMYFLVFYLTEKNMLSLFAGVIYAFCPYHFARAWQHLGLAQIQWMPLYILTLLKLKENLTYKNMILSLASLFLVISFELHYAYFMYIVTILFLAYCLFSNRKIDKEYLRLMGLVFIIMIMGVLFILPTSATIGIRQAFFERKTIQPSVWSAVRPFEDLFSQSARPLSYFLPALVHPLFGEFTENFIGSSLYGTSLTEHTLYLGWVPLLLAFVAIKRWKSRRKEIKDLGMLPFVDSPYHKENFYIGFFILLAIVAWLFSQPPWWNVGPLKIYMPSFFMYKIVPMFRAYCRFGILVMLGIAVLAGFGLKFILEKFKTQKTKIAMIALFCGLVLFEFWNWPPYKVIDVSKAPAVYYWLKEHPGDFVIAEYPLDADSANEIYKFYQTKHEKKIINGTIPGTPANKLAQTIIKLSDPKTVGVLKWMSVKYVLVHREDYLKTELTQEIEELAKIPNNYSLKFIKNFPAQECPRKDIMCVQKTGPIDVYEVMTEPIEPKIKEK